MEQIDEVEFGIQEIMEGGGLKWLERANDVTVFNVHEYVATAPYRKPLHESPR